MSQIDLARFQVLVESILNETGITVGDLAKYKDDYTDFLTGEYGDSIKSLDLKSDLEKALAMVDLLAGQIALLQIILLCIIELQTEDEDGDS